MNATKFINEWIEADWRLSENITLKTIDYFSSYEDLGQITRYLANDIRKTFANYIHDKTKDNVFMVALSEEFLSQVNWSEIASGFVECEYEAMENWG